MRRKLLFSLLAILLAFTCLALGEGLITCEHEYDQTSYQSDDSFHWFVCSKCGKAVEQAGHTPACIDHADATATDDGYALFQCTVCAHEWRTLLPATGAPDADDNAALPLTVSAENSVNEEPADEAPAENIDVNDETPAENEPAEEPVANADAPEAPAESANAEDENPAENEPAEEPVTNADLPEAPAESANAEDETPAENEPAEEPVTNADLPEAPAESANAEDENPAENEPTEEPVANADAPEAPAESANAEDENPAENEPAEEPEDNANAAEAEQPASQEPSSSESSIAAPQAGAALLSDTNSDEAADTDKHEHYAVCTAPTKCAECGVDYAGEDIRHKYTWNCDSDNHWQKCSNSSCGATTSKVAHVLKWTDNGETHSASCDECGYALWNESHYSPCSTPGYCKCGIAYSGNVVHTGIDYDDWKIEGEYHWLLCSTCGERIDYHVHVAACNNQTVCMVCGAQCSNVPLAHEIDRDTWQIEGDYHWNGCINCGKKLNYGQHTLTCGSSDNNCSVCGTEYSGANIQHTTSSDWLYDPDYHWHVCSTCNQIYDKGKHYASCDTNGICNECGSPYTDPTPGHYFNNDVYESDETYHWNPCSKCGSRVNEIKHYTYCNDTSGKCSECGESYSNLRIDHHIDWDNRGSDELYHWYNCKAEGCTAQIDKELHYRSCVSSTKCKWCGEECSSTSVVHNTSGNPYQSDENYHWRACIDCNVVVYKSPHSAYCNSRTKCADCGRISTSGDYDFYHPYLGATVFESDATHHWRTCEACGLKIEDEHFAFCDTNGKCTMCDADFIAPDPTHHWDDDYDSDGTYHWHSCIVCKAEVDKNKHYRYCNDTSGKCSECGEAYTGTNLQHHQWSNDYIGYDGTFHWRICTLCNEKVGNPQRHRVDCQNPGNCTRCGASVTGDPLHDHNYSTEYTTDENYHWYVCLDCGAASTKNAHFGSCSGSGKCTACNAKYTGDNHGDYTITRIDETYHEKICNDCGTHYGKEEHIASCISNGLCSYCRSETTNTQIRHYTPWLEYGKDETYHWLLCNCCDAQVDKTEHTKTLIDHEDAGCATTGYNKYKCDDCQHEWTETIPATGNHELSYQKSETQHWQTCANCDYTSEKADHAKSTIDHQDASCASEGYNKYKCDDCQYEWTETIPATGNHELAYQKSETQHWQTCANCDYVSEKANHTASLIEETASYQKYQCSACDYEWTEAISAECSHSWSVVSETPASCLTDGSITYKCSLCSETRTETVSARGEHTIVTVYGREATCTQSGYTNGKSCSVCGAVIEARQSIPQLEHNWQQSSQTAPSCTAEGKTIYTCSNCRETREESIPALEHDWQQSSQTAPSCTAEGKTVYACSNCRETREESIPALEHRYSAYRSAGDGTHVSTCENGCGDSKVRSCDFESVTTGLFTYSTCKVCAYTTYTVKESPAQDETVNNAAVAGNESDEGSADDSSAVEPAAAQSTVSVEAEKAILTLATEIATAPEAVETVQIENATITVVDADEVDQGSMAPMIPEGAQLVVHEQSLPEEMTTLPGAQMLHIALAVDGETVEHAGKVKVEIPTEQLLDTQDMSAMRLVLIASDGTMIEIPYEIIEGKLVFTTDMLGLFAFVPVEAA